MRRGRRPGGRRAVGLAGPRASGSAPRLSISALASSRSSPSAVKSRQSTTLIVFSPSAMHSLEFIISAQEEGPRHERDGRAPREERQGGRGRRSAASSGSWTGSRGSGPGTGNRRSGPLRLLLEECSEALDALAREQWGEVEGELGDLLLRDRLPDAAREQDRGLRPRLGGPADPRRRWWRGTLTSSAAPTSKDADGVRLQWEAVKEQERKESGLAGSWFDGFPKALPALLKAVRMTSPGGGPGLRLGPRRGRPPEARRGGRRVQGRSAPENAPKSMIAHEIGDILFRS